jgi:hypothetical protein
MDAKSIVDLIAIIRGCEPITESLAGAWQDFYIFLVDLCPRHMTQDNRSKHNLDYNVYVLWFALYMINEWQMSKTDYEYILEK